MFPSWREFPTASSMFSAYMSFTASMMLVRTAANDLLPQPIRHRVISTVRSLFRRRSSFILTIEEFNGISKNEVFEASEVYLSTKLSPDTEAFKITKSPKDQTFTIQLHHGEKIIDHFQGVELAWNFCSVELENRKDRYNDDDDTLQCSEKRSFILKFDKCHKGVVLNSYIPYILKMAKNIEDNKRFPRIFTLSHGSSIGGHPWNSINLEHPATFDTIAMDPDQKSAIIDDLDRFLKGKDFYKRIGRAWKRGYLLYGPPGTGKSSLVAAMANHLKFDVYDLQLNNNIRDSDLRSLLLNTKNRSILVIEDIDCSVNLRRHTMPVEDNTQRPNLLLTLSGILNFIDGLWSSCGDERIIVFTTNYMERLDPALLRPGRMDMHINMSYCTFEAFKCLASNYLNLGPPQPQAKHQRIYEEIKSTIDEAKVTPAQVAGEMMRSDDVDVALDGVVKLLKRKKLGDDTNGAEIEIPESKRAKVNSEENATSA